METLTLYALCTASLFYLGSRALITSFLWSRYPRQLASFMDCSACSGTWYGGLVGYVGGYHLGLPFLGLPGDSPATVAAVALCSMAWTPIVAGFVQRGFDALGSAVDSDEPEQPAEPATRAGTDTSYIERPHARQIAGTITPREIPSVRIPSLRAHNISTRSDGFECSCGEFFSTVGATDQGVIAVARRANQHADENNGTRPG